MKKSIALVLLACSWLWGALIIGNGTKTVATAGTAVALASPTNAEWVTVQALSSNTGMICLGGPSVIASLKNGTCLSPGQAAPLYAAPIGIVYDLSLIYVDATNSGDGVSYTYAH